VQTPPRAGLCPILLAGVAVLFLGRKAFWLFVVVVGSGGGWAPAPYILPDQPEVIHLPAVLAGAFVGAVLVLLLQRNAAALAGGALGCFVIFWVLDVSGAHFYTPPLSMQWWMLLIVGVGVPAVPASVNHDFALIALSSITGTVLIVEAPQLPAIPIPSFAVIPAGMVLLVAGIVVQTMPFKQR